MYYGEPIHYVPRRSPSCCKRYYMEAAFCFWLVLLAGCLLCITYFYYKNTVSGQNICVRKQCIKSSSEILDFLDTSKDPCKSFNLFTCGQFRKVALERNVTSAVDLEKDKIKNELIALVTTPPIYRDSEIIIMQKRFFQYCLDVKTIDLNGDQLFFNLLDSIGGWPILQKQFWRERDFDWLGAMVNARRVGLPFEWFLRIELERDFLKVSYPDFCNSPRNDFPREYLKYMLDVTVNMTGLGVAVIPEVNEMFNFEQELNQICGKSTFEDSKTGNFITIGTIRDLQAFSKIDWITFLKKFKYDNWTADSVIAYDASHYLLRLERLLTRTTKRTQANYIAWKMIEHFAPFLSYPIRTMHESYVLKRTGSNTNRWSFCLNETKSRFRYVSEIQFVRNERSYKIKKDVNEMFVLIKDQILNLTVDLDNNTRDYFKRYGDMEVEIGGYDQLFASDVFEKYLHFHMFNFSSYNIIVMITELSRSFYESSLNSFGTNKIEDLKIDESIDFKVWFDPNQNKLVIPIPLLRNFFYDQHSPQYLNFGSLGTLIGVEMIQVFKNSQNIFSELSGIEASYKAYKTWEKSQHPEQVLPGLSYEADELFWIKAGMNSCRHQEAQEEVDYIFLEKSLYFQEIFKCSNN